MASTKIINVLKDDKFEEILDLFKNTQAEEVIFVLPKTSRAFKKEEHFATLNSEAVKNSRKVSLLCSNPDINTLAKKYKFDVLLAQDDKSNEDDETETDEMENKSEEKEMEQEEEPTPKFSPAVYNEDDEKDDYRVITISKTQRGLDDIVKQSGASLRIVANKDRPTPISVKKKSSYQSADEIKNVWREQSERVSNSKDNIWAGINNRTKKSFGNFPKNSLVGLGAISVVLFGVIIYMSTGSAKVNITPEKRPLNMQIRISASDRFSSVSAELNKIPGQLFNVEKSATQTFLTTGEKEVAQKARGKITVFNEYGTTPQPLIATTRFQTPDGLIFRTLKGITVPGTKVENGKIIPGSISVEVIADKPGQSYNISPTKFSVPAFNEHGDAGRYGKIYAKSDEAMKGGAIGKAKVVTDTDFNTAKQTLSDQVTKDVEDSFKTQTSGLKVINSSAIKFKELESTFKADEATDSFIMTVSGSIKTVGFKEDDLKQLIKQYIDKNLNLTALPEKLTISYDNITFDEISNILMFTVNIDGDGYAKLDTDKIKTDLTGKNEVEIKNYLKGTEGIESAKVILSPFWVKRIPQNKEKTKLQINY